MWRRISFALALTLLLSPFSAPVAHASATLSVPSSLGLVGWWKFDEGSGIAARDYSGRGNTGTLSGTTLPTWVSGKLGKGLSFDGSTAYVNVGNVSALGFERTNAFSVSEWIKGACSACSLTGKMNNASPFTGWDLEISGNAPAGRLSFYLINEWNTNAIQVLTTRTVNDNQWHHIVATYDGSSSASGVKLYVDGLLQSMTTGNDS